FFQCSSHHRHLHSFPTRRSSDLEVEVIGEEILHLCKEKGIAFSDIQIYAPEIELYMPLIEFVFSKRSIPFRFPHFGDKNHEMDRDRKSTRLNSSHVAISYAVFCL